jgi:hypothetical protein
MTGAVLDVLTELQDLVEQETALLDSLDYPAAVRLLSSKQALTDALQAALADRPAETADEPDLRARLTDLAAAADANQAALTRSLAVQAKLMDTIAAAIPRARAEEAPIYRANGGKLPFRPPLPYAFIKQM